MTRALVRFLVALVAISALGLLAVWGVVSLLSSLDAEPLAAEQCTAENDGVRHSLSHEQAQNAALLAATSVRRGLPARAATIAIATAMQESSLRNIDHGDRDSLGLFQQRPSQGWGSAEEIMDPVYSTETFYAALEKVEGYESMEITVAAQTVQRSAFPDAYAQHETMSRAWASALTGHSPAALTCVVREPATGSTDALRARLARDFGDVPVEVADGEGRAAVEVDASVLAGAGGEGEGRLAWAVGQWFVAAAPELGIAEVRVADQRWVAADARWVPEASEPRLPAGRVLVTVHGSA